jgi:DNA polymerase bacteriophage-type
MSDAPPVQLDFESKSRCDLKARGGRNYWADPSTEVLCCVWYDPASGRVGCYTPDNPKGRPPPGRQYAAHNAENFDRFGAVREGWCRPEDAWVDTSQLARTAGFPGKLEALGKEFGYPKDLASSRFTKGLSTVRRPAGKGPDAIPPAEWKLLTKKEKACLGVQKTVTEADLARVIGYCSRDVEIMAEAWPMLESWRDLEAPVVAVNRAINDRGVPFDSDLAKALLECDRINGRRVVKRVARELGWSYRETRDVAKSPKKFCAATGARNAQKETVAALDHPLARARQALASIVAGKLRAGLERVSPDGLLRDTHLYYGGHTGRWSSIGMQLHNMTRPAKEYEEWTGDQLSELVARVTAGAHHATPQEADFLLRATIWSGHNDVLVVRDFKGVEARMLAWCSGDTKALEIFRSDEIDPYKVAAAKVFGCAYADVDKVQRTVGKILELACGYGQGGGKFAETAAKMGADLAALGIDSYAAVKAWRQLHAPSVKFWYDVERAFRRAIEGHASEVSCFDFEPSSNGKDVAIFLPTGRPVVYRNARFSREKGRRGQSIVYEGGKTGREHTYGGKLVENIIQALCRELLARALVKAERRGLNPVLHVHDEAVCRVRKCERNDAAGELQDIMTSLPSWAKRGPYGAFPIGAAGFEGERYRK